MITKEKVLPGDELPCHKENIIHTEDGGLHLRIWYTENDKNIK